MGKVLSIVYRAVATHLRRKAGYTKATAQTGAITLIQRFGGAVNLNIHMLFLDGVYIDSADRSRARFRWVKAPTSNELTQLTHTIARLVALVPKPRVHLTRYHGVFAPHSKYRALVTPAKRGNGKKGIAAQQQPERSPGINRSWALNYGPDCVAIWLKTRYE